MMSANPARVGGDHKTSPERLQPGERRQRASGQNIADAHTAAAGSRPATDRIEIRMDGRMMHARAYPLWKELELLESDRRERQRRTHAKRAGDDGDVKERPELA